MEIEVLPLEVQRQGLDVRELVWSEYREYLLADGGQRRRTSTAIRIPVSWASGLSV